ncbi:response regulator [Haloplanus sp. GCM10025708]|uniref:PAS domain-containing response regulator n=1 Tax=Haloferacaceae TaxID=1644056 RepID=UPI0036199F2F
MGSTTPDIEFATSLDATPIRVLHVDDEPDLAELVSTFLERENPDFEVLTETDATAALTRLSDDKESIDCVISDYEMPGMDGIEFLETVREDYPELPFLLYTGKGSEEVASDAISAGVTDYMQKESGTDQYTVLANRIVNAVDQYRVQQEAVLIRRRLEELAESSTDCLWMFDREWEELLFISGYEAVWKRPTQAIKDDPRDFLTSVHPEDRDFVKTEMKRISNGESRDIEYRILRGDGETGWVWVKGEPVFDDGEVVRVVGFTRDITARKRRERELERHDRIIQNLPVGVYRTTPDGEIVDANERFVSMFGAESFEQLRNVRSRNLYSEPTDRETLIERIEREGALDEYPVDFETLDGEPFRGELSLRLVNEDGEEYLDGIIQAI